jgi:nucleotide-binding universal stress UspA family protein
MTSHHGTIALLEPRDAVRLTSRDGSSGQLRVVAALRELPRDAPVLREAIKAARRRGSELVVLHAVPLSFAQRSVGLDRALEQGRQLLADAEAEATAAGVPTSVRLERVRPYELVGEGLDADLLVIGGPPAGSPRGLGLVAQSAARHAPCPVLVVPHEG